ncbi:response regulator [Mariprofundus erugo]|uniref:hybrid sensor histidine kinase/response regulator n=1 Tax=Mariprofundus erugo TaxID=2528639 RepID=UPI0010FEA68C|nr:PAS domain-containing sensor histidine kinase [Mariprofundus erugo]TLS76217.1 response regulator [Mariprofundus erugo]
MLKRLPLTLKLLIITILAAALFSFIIDTYHNRQLYKLYESELLDTLKQQARIERLRFDYQIKFFMQISRVAANYPPLIRQLHSGKAGELKINLRRKPVWFPGRSLISSQVHPRLVMLLNPDGTIHNSFSTQLRSIPISLQPPSGYLLTHSIGQTMLSMIDNKPWVLATSGVYDEGVLQGYLMLASPLDAEFLSNAHRYDVAPNLTALVDVSGKEPVILASSNSELVPPGMPLGKIEKSYLVTGKEFFDYGSSDLPLHFISLQSKKKIDDKLNIVLHVANQQRNLQSAGLALVFILAIAGLTYRMRRLSREVAAFAREHLGVEISSQSADSLARLEHDIHLLEKKVVEVHEQEINKEKAEKQKARQQLHISEMRLYEFFNQADELIQSVSPEGDIRYVNQRWMDELGYTPDEIACINISSIVAQPCLIDHFKRLEQLADGGSPGLFESILVTRDGAQIEVEGSSHAHIEDGKLIEVHTIYRNVSMRKQLEREAREHREHLEHTQRLESLGVLAGGIAHDFNNILTTILGNAAIMSRHIPRQSEAYDRLQRVIESTERGGDLCKQMLAYAGKGKFMIRPINLSTMMQEITKLLSVSISKHVTLTYQLENELPSISGDAAQIQQVMMNLIINASEAIGDQRGEIHVSTGVIDAGPSLLDSCLANKPVPGSYVWIEVRDNGCGMSPEVQKKIFEPFFTTKLSGRGLGMSAILGIIKAHQGALKLTSAPGSGTTFTVYFPVSDKRTTPSLVDTETRPYMGSYPGKTVLVIDDEESIRELAVVLLNEQGIHTLEAVDGEDGIARFKEHMQHIDMVILDLTMPKLSGENCCREIRKLRPDVPVIIASGYSKETVSPRFLNHEVTAFLQKPYTPDAFYHVVHSIFDHRN